MMAGLHLVLRLTENVLPRMHTVCFLRACLGHVGRILRLRPRFGPSSAEHNTLNTV